MLRGSDHFFYNQTLRPTEAPKERVFIRTPALVVLHKYIGYITALLKFGAPIVKDGYKRAALFTS